MPVLPANTPMTDARPEQHDVDAGATAGDGRRLAGLLAEFDSPAALCRAAAAARRAGWQGLDAHGPFPIHGIERALGMRASRLPWLVLAAGATGLAVAILLQWWTNAVDYPWIVSGKPRFSLPANIPIAFELVVLFSAIVAFVLAIALGGLPRWNHPVFTADRFARATTDGFFLWVDAKAPAFELEAAQRLLVELGARTVEPCFEPTAAPRLPAALWWTVAALCVLALLPPVLVARHRHFPKSQPRIHLIHDMDYQPKYLPQAPSPRMADGRAMRPDVLGTVARGFLADDPRVHAGRIGEQWVEDFPVDVTIERMRRGQQRFEIFCATCHGLAGEGGNTSMTSARALKRGDAGWVLPSSLVTDAVAQQPAGQIFDSITRGVRTMPSYAAQIPADDRWSIVLYVRALQRSQRATIDDVPEDLRTQLRSAGAAREGEPSVATAAGDQRAERHVAVQP